MVLGKTKHAVTLVFAMWYQDIHPVYETLTHSSPSSVVVYFEDPSTHVKVIYNQDRQSLHQVLVTVHLPDVRGCGYTLVSEELLTTGVGGVEGDEFRLRP